MKIFIKATHDVPQRTLYDYRGTDGTGTADSPATGSNIRSYTIKKLADGNCWMTENLKLTLTGDQDVEITSNSTGESAGMWTPKSTGGDGSASYPINQNTKTGTQSSTGEWYYSWWAANAGSTATTNGENAENSICPVGWRMPQGYIADTEKTYDGLLHAYNSRIIANASTSGNFISIIESNVLNFSRLGRYYSGSLNSNTAGFYWTSTVYYINQYVYNYIYSLHYTESGVDLSNNFSKSYGLPIRCVNA